MAADAFVQNFLAFSNAEDRAEALKKLSLIITPAERQEVLRAISGRNDRIPTLPLEILLQIFSHLRIEEAWSLQLVNRSWRRVLTSEQFLRTTLLRLNTHDSSDSGRRAECIAKDSLHDRILHAQSLKLGKPISLTEFDDTGTGLQGPQPQLSHRKLDLKGKRIAYISTFHGEFDTVVLRDLETGSRHTFRGDARERILSLALSTELLVFVTFHGALHVIRLADPELHTRRQLPSAHVRALGVDGHLVAVAMGANGITHITEALILNVASGRLKSLDVEATSKDDLDGTRALNSFSLLVDRHQESLDLFALALERDGFSGARYVEIHHFRVCFAGKVLIRSVPQTDYNPMDENEHLRSSHFTMAPPVPNGYRGQFRIQIGEIPLLGGLPLRHRSDETFDIIGSADYDDMEQDWTEVEAEFIRGQQPLRWETAGSPRQAVDSRKPPPTLWAQWKTLGLQAIANEPGDDWLEYYSLMNDTFLVSLEVSAARMQHSRIRIFCFDPKFELHNGRSTGFWEDGKLLPGPRWRRTR